MEHEGEVSGKPLKSRKVKAIEHKHQLERLKDKDPEFYRFLKENDKELLEFKAEEFEDNDSANEVDDREAEDIEEILDASSSKKEEESSELVTTSVVDQWCKSVREEGKIGALRNLLKAFRFACHYGDDDGDDASKKFRIMSSHVFNKIMVFVLSEVDGILRNLLDLPTSGGQKQSILDLMNTRRWKNYNNLVKSYLGNAFHVLNQMTDTDMLSFTLRRLKKSVIFLAAFPSLLRKYIKVVLHYWGTGSESLTVVAFLFLRDLCLCMGSDIFEVCLRGIYNAYVSSCDSINAMKLQHINFLANCVTEILRLDVAAGYYHAFVYIRQLALILRDAMTVKTKESFQKVHKWNYINCLELWTGAVCALSSEAEFKALAYPLTQIISGTARSVTTARYIPLRLRCIRMLNRIGAATKKFTPVSMILLDMLEMKELSQNPAKGLGNSVDLRSVLKVRKPMLKTRAFQEACVVSVIEELSEHFSQWSYSIAFLEMSFISAVRLRSFIKSAKVDRFRKELRELVRQIEENLKFIEERRNSFTLRPNDPALAIRNQFKDEVIPSPLSQFVGILHQRAQKRNTAMLESSIVVGEDSSTFENKVSVDKDDEQAVDAANGAAIFSTDWLPSGKPEDSPMEEKTTKKRKTTNLQRKSEAGSDEDIVEDLVLSSEDDEVEDKIVDKVKGPRVSNSLKSKESIYFSPSFPKSGRLRKRPSRRKSRIAKTSSS